MADSSRSHSCSYSQRPNRSSKSKSKSKQGSWTSPFERGHASALARLYMTEDVVRIVHYVATAHAEQARNVCRHVNFRNCLSELVAHRRLHEWCVSVERRCGHLIDRFDAEAALVSNYCGAAKKRSQRLYHAELWSMVELMNTFLVPVLERIVRLDLTQHRRDVRFPDHDPVGGAPTDFEHDVVYPLAEHAWECLIRGRALRFPAADKPPTSAGKRGRKTRYFGMAPSADSVGSCLRLLTTDCMKGEVMSGRLNYSHVSDVLQMQGLAKVVSVSRTVCSRCGRPYYMDEHRSRCPGLPVVKDRRYLLATDYLSRLLPVQAEVNSHVQAGVDARELMTAACRRIRDAWRRARSQRKRGLSKLIVYAVLAGGAYASTDGRSDGLPDELTDEQVRRLFWEIRDAKLTRQRFLEKADGLCRTVDVTSTNFGVIVARLRREVLPEYFET